MAANWDGVARVADLCATVRPVGAARGGPWAVFSHVHEGPRWMIRYAGLSWICIAAV
jgi:hypothetical protein